MLGGAGLKNRWHSFPRKRGHTVLGFFPVDDSHIQTNPIYGRGCSMAFVQAHALRAAIDAHTDPGERIRAYLGRLERALEPHYDFCVSGDRGFWPGRSVREGRS